MTKQKSPDLKTTAVKYYLTNKNATYETTCKIFDCSLRSLKRWIQKYIDTKNLERKKRIEGSYKVLTEHVKFIREELKNNPDMIIKDLHLKLLDKFPKSPLNRQYIHKIIRDNNITRKRAVFSHFPVLFRGKPRDKKKEMAEFFEVINKYELDDIISIDETSIKPGMFLKYCRGKLGQRCEIKTDTNEIYKKYSLIVAISNKQCLGYKIYDEGSVNAERFEEFLQSITKDRQNKLFVLDNAQIHKRPNVKDIIKNSKNNIVYTLIFFYRIELLIL